MSHMHSVFAVGASLDAEGLIPPGVVLEGVVQAGSYDQNACTIQVLIGHTAAAAAFGDGDQPMIVSAVLAKVGYGEQYGPIGNERALVWRAGTQNVALLHCSNDDTAGTPSGEFWNVHRHPSTGVIDSYDKMTNDGAAANDGKGGRQLFVGGYAKFVTTNGLQITLNDTANQIELQTPGGLTVILDGATNTLQIGGSGNATQYALINQGLLQNALNAFATAIMNWGGANFARGTSSPGTLTAPTPAGSTKGFTA